MFPYGKWFSCKFHKGTVGSSFPYTPDAIWMWVEFSATIALVDFSHRIHWRGPDSILVQSILQHCFYHETWFYVPFLLDIFSILLHSISFYWVHLLFPFPQLIVFALLNPVILKSSGLLSLKDFHIVKPLELRDLLSGPVLVFQDL